MIANKKYVLIEEATQHAHPVKTWALGLVLEVGDFVWNNGVTFEVQVAHTAATENEPILEVVQGAPGPAGMSWKGEWSAIVSYVPTDAVYVGVNNYICITANLNDEPPSENWQIFAEGVAGTDGNTILNGAAVPTTEGVNGDYYIETTNGHLYGPKAAGAWPGTYLDLVGATGATGANGTNGAAGAAGANAYVYVAYAYDAAGTNFTLTFNAALDYIAVLATTVEIPAPVVGDFAGLWKNYKGATGERGFTHKGAWTDATTYDQFDAVGYGNNTWLALQGTNLNHPPEEGAWWTLIISGAGVSNHRVYSAIPTPAPDGIVSVFTVPESFVSGSEKVNLNGLEQLRDTDFTTDPSGGEITWIGTPLPPTGSILIVDYDHDDVMRTSNTLLHGAGAPSDANDGIDGDYYKNDATTLFYGPKAAGAWPAGVDYHGDDGDFIYVAYASADDGTDFTLTFSAALDYIAILRSAIEIVTPLVADFAGLWKNYKGESGDVTGTGTPADHQLAQYNGTGGKAIEPGPVVVTTVGTTGADSNVPTEQAVRELIDAFRIRNHAWNSSFEFMLGTAACLGWGKIEATVTVAQDTGIRDGYGGANAIKITSVGSAKEGVLQIIKSLKASTLYTVRIWMKVTAGDTAKAWTTGATSNLSITSTNTSGEWVTGTFTTDATPTDVVFKLGSDTSGDIIWFDCLSITESAEIPAAYRKDQEWDVPKQLHFGKGDGSAVVATGVISGFSQAQDNYEIVGWILTSDISATVTMDVWKKSTFPPTNTESLGTTKVTMTATNANGVPDWSVREITKGDWIGAEIEANDAGKAIDFFLLVRRR